MSLKLKRYLTVFIAVVTFGVPLLIPATSFAAVSCNHVQNEISVGLKEATGGETGYGCGGNATIRTGIKNIAVQAVNIISIIVGVVAIIMIIYGGFKYITSGGESNNISTAKNTLIYAIIGLIVVALAQVIVHWVLDTSSSIATPPAAASFIRIIFP